MMSHELRELLIPKIRLYLNRSSWQYIDTMLDNAYRTYEEGMSYINVPPPVYSGLDLGFQFQELTGIFIQMVDMDLIKAIGDKV